MAGSAQSELKGHTDYVNTLALLRDGRVASGSDDTTIRISDVSRCTCDAVLEGHTDSVYGLVQLPDGRLASGSRDNTIRLWSIGASSGTCVGVLETGTAVLSLALLHDGGLVSGHYDGSIRLWSLTGTGGSCIKVIPGRTGTMYALAVLAAGRIASGGSDRTVRIQYSYRYDVQATADHSSLLVSQPAASASPELVSRSVRHGAAPVAKTNYDTTTEISPYRQMAQMSTKQQLLPLAEQQSGLSVAESASMAAANSTHTSTLPIDASGPHLDTPVSNIDSVMIDGSDWPPVSALLAYAVPQASQSASKSLDHWIGKAQLRESKLYQLQKVLLDGLPHNTIIAVSCSRTEAETVLASGLSDEATDRVISALRPYLVITPTKRSIDDYKQLIEKCLHQAAMPPSTSDPVVHIEDSHVVHNCCGRWYCPDVVLQNGGHNCCPHKLRELDRARSGQLMVLVEAADTIGQHDASVNGADETVFGLIERSTMTPQPPLSSSLGPLISFYSATVDSSKTNDNNVVAAAATTTGSAIDAVTPTYSTTRYAIPAGHIMLDDGEVPKCVNPCDVCIVSDPRDISNSTGAGTAPTKCPGCDRHCVSLSSSYCSVDTELWCDPKASALDLENGVPLPVIDVTVFDALLGTASLAVKNAFGANYRYQLVDVALLYLQQGLQSEPSESINLPLPLPGADGSMADVNLHSAFIVSLQASINALSQLKQKRTNLYHNGWFSRMSGKPTRLIFDSFALQVRENFVGESSDSYGVSSWPCRRLVLSSKREHHWQPGIAHVKLQ
jgi:WD40 repeat protein